ncbi:MAG TPA: fumarylacetoacetate hydrolase family protein [Aliicoccus persicus]|uniref:Fumarylacetoacetate hydrolase family protein n=1 Tax=Aliicoccus persicus TaxID=930138 RepID=A0A921DWK3_9STAP|nr:fumarylacetoacetate hydrolase family protein [Aliicoccus persicus]
MNVAEIGTVYGTLLNFKGAYDALEPQMHDEPYKAPPKAPVFYIKPKNTFASDGDVIEKPVDEAIVMGGTIGVVMGQNASRVARDEAMAYVAGFVVANDVAIAHDNFFRPAYPKRARDGFLPLGDYKDKSEIHDIDNIEIQVLINDEIKQTSILSDLIRDIPTLIQDASEFMTLSAGDILLVGTDTNAPSAEPRDTVRVVVPGIGTLENTIGGGRQ